MPEKGWKSISLPEGLVAEIEDIVEKKAAYISVSEFVRAAVSRLIEDIENREVI